MAFERLDCGQQGPDALICRLSNATKVYYAVATTMQRLGQLDAAAS